VALKKGYQKKKNNKIVSFAISDSKFNFMLIFRYAFLVEVEFTAGLFANSLALITDGTHALLDAVVTAILIIAVRVALKPKEVLRWSFTATTAMSQ
jgi:Co/Zn/Cd efflux system component